MRRESAGLQANRGALADSASSYTIQAGRCLGVWHHSTGYQQRGVEISGIIGHTSSALVEINQGPCRLPARRNMLENMLKHSLEQGEGVADGSVAVPFSSSPGFHSSRERPYSLLILQRSALVETNVGVRYTGQLRL
ncbi:hypothetical protein CRENBAI_015109 [Crenichthys baileyi]|uniref:Uncharacterized protein n=1 Tax=Crenichthys baileyi TaxID=28760 RepID=A0AAV9SIP7_9TELE